MPIIHVQLSHAIWWTQIHQLHVLLVSVHVLYKTVQLVIVKNVAADRHAYVHGVRMDVAKSHFFKQTFFLHCVKRNFINIFTYFVTGGGIWPSYASHFFVTETSSEKGIHPCPIPQCRCVSQHISWLNGLRHSIHIERNLIKKWLIQQSLGIQVFSRLFWITLGRLYYYIFFLFDNVFFIWL